MRLPFPTVTDVGPTDPFVSCSTPKRRLGPAGCRSAPQRRCAAARSSHRSPSGVRTRRPSARRRRNRARAGDFVAGRLGELVGGIPARVWDYSGWQTPSRWSRSTFAAYVGDRVQISERLLIDGGLRFERVTGEAAGAAQGVSWHDLYPRVSARWEPTGSPAFPCFRGSAATDMHWRCAGWQSVIRPRPSRPCTGGSRQAAFGHRGPARSDRSSRASDQGPAAKTVSTIETASSGIVSTSL